MPQPCETCLERGRQRPGTHRVGAGWMCDPCFRGDGTRTEQLGGMVTRENSKYKRIYYQEHRPRILKRFELYRRKHRQEITAKQRAERKRQNNQ